MNLELLASLPKQNYPEVLEGFLDCVSLAVTCVFNKYGTLLAVGCNDGRIVIWDFLNKRIAKVISAHTHPVCSLSWSRYGQKLLSASTDNNVCNWDVLSGEREEMYKFPYSVLEVQYHPRKKNVFLVCLMKHAAVLVDTEGNHKVVPLDKNSDLMIVASFDRRGQYIYTGNARGKILVLTCPELEVKASFKVFTGITGVKSIEFARRGDSFLLNCSDRVIRVYDSNYVLRNGKDGDTKPIYKLHDFINKTKWKKCSFSGDGKLICACSARLNTMYIWDKSTLVKILFDNVGELLLDVAWHPVRRTITSISNGLVSVWAQKQEENLSAYPPGFKELEENVECEENDSEFELKDISRSISNDEDLEVDVETYEPITAFCSSDEEEVTDEKKKALVLLPVHTEIEDPEPDMPSPQVSSTASSKFRSFDIHLKNSTNELHPLLWF